MDDGSDTLIDGETFDRAALNAWLSHVFPVRDPEAGAAFPPQTLATGQAADAAAAAAAATPSAGSSGQAGLPSSRTAGPRGPFGHHGRYASGWLGPPIKDFGLRSGPGGESTEVSPLREGPDPRAPANDNPQLGPRGRPPRDGRASPADGGLGLDSPSIPPIRPGIRQPINTLSSIRPTAARLPVPTRLRPAGRQPPALVALQSAGSGGEAPSDQTSGATAGINVFIPQSGGGLQQLTFLAAESPQPP